MVSVIIVAIVVFLHLSHDFLWHFCICCLHFSQYRPYLLCLKQKPSLLAAGTTTCTCLFIVYVYSYITV